METTLTVETFLIKNVLRFSRERKGHLKVFSKRKNISLLIQTYLIAIG